MRALILYMSQHGTTRKVTHELQQKLGEQNTDLIDLGNEKPGELAGYDTVIIGGSIHAGQIQKKIRKFCKDNLSRLLEQKVGLFICFMNEAHGQKEFEDAFPKELRNHSSANGLFG